MTEPIVTAPEGYELVTLGRDDETGEPLYEWRRHGWEVLAAADALADAAQGIGPATLQDALVAYRALRSAPETAHSAQHGPE